MSKRPGVYIVTALVLLLIVLHQDNWNWNDGTLVFGFIPIGLFYHACISVAASIVWFIATLIAWPTDLAEPANPADSPESRGE